MSGLVGGNTLAGVAVGLASQTIGPLFARLIDLIPDPTEKARQAAAAQQQIMALDAQIAQQQSAINTAEATNNKLLVSGWRPFIGWICGAGLAWQILLQPTFTFWLAAFGLHPAFPVLDSTFVTMLLVPMLGLGGMKTVERMGGVSNEGQRPTQTIVVQPSRAVLEMPSKRGDGTIYPLGNG